MNEAQVEAAVRASGTLIYAIETALDGHLRAREAHSDLVSARHALRAKGVL